MLVESVRLSDCTSPLSILMSSSVQELFNISDQLAKNLEITHKLAVPKISKIVINSDPIKLKFVLFIPSMN